MHALSRNVWLAIFLPRPGIDRLIRSARAPKDRPLAVYAKQANAFVLTGVDARASALGLRAGMALADARAIHPDLATAEAELEADASMLDDIAAWCGRFTPIVVLDAPDGLFLDVTGCTHLFGGEEALRDDIVTRLGAQGFAARAALGATPGAAWALARYGAAPPPLEGRGLGGGVKRDARSFSHAQRFTPPPAPSPNRGGGALLSATLAPLPVEALRLDCEAAALLRRLGLKTVGQLIAAPRSSFTARAGERAMLRLDQALGRASEALSPRRPAPPLFALARFLEPLFSVEAMLEATQTLCLDAAAQLEIRGVGIRRACLHLFGVDGRDRVIEIGLSRPEREVKVLLRLFREKLNIAAESLDAEFGIEAARLDVVQMERIAGAPRALMAEEAAQASAEQIAAIVDLLTARLGPSRVLRPLLRDAHAPERAGGWVGALLPPRGGGPSRSEGEGGRAGSSASDAVAFPSARPPPVGLRPTPSPQGGGLAPPRRPLTLFSRAQPIDAIATVPDGPPIRFRWRRVLREVARAEGPERIAGDWLKGEATRDFYRVEDAQGRRYWLYREGLYGETSAPRWFMAGLFS